MRKITTPQNVCPPLNIWASLFTRRGNAIFSIPFSKVVHPRIVIAILQSATQRLCATTVAKPNRKVMYPVDTVMDFSSVYCTYPETLLQSTTVQG